MIDIREKDILMDEIADVGENIGAVVSFLGIVRRDDGVKEMHVEAYDELALKELEKIRREAFDRFHVRSINIIHRKGRLSVGDRIMLVSVGAEHRKDAFEACRYIIEEIKKRAPLWKKEILENREERWAGSDERRKK